MTAFHHHWNSSTDPYPSTPKENIMALTIVTGSDNAGYGHKSALKELLENDPRVEQVIDVGVTGREDGTFYPNVAVEAAEKIEIGRAHV